MGLADLWCQDLLAEEAGLLWNRCNLSGSMQSQPTANSIDCDCYLTAFVDILMTGKDFLAEIPHLLVLLSRRKERGWVGR